MKIDIFNHIFPKIFYDKMMQVNPDLEDIGKRAREVPVIYDLDARFKVMDMFDDYAQVICLASPPIELLAGPDVTPDLAKAANDGMAEYVAKYPDRFPGFIASLPMNNPPACVEEIDRSIKDLKAVGVQVFTNVNGAPLDLPELKPLFERMNEHDLPIWIHPARTAKFPDYLTEDKSEYEIWWTFGWPYETSVAMARLVFGGYFDAYPNLKIITHHMGAMIPHFSERIKGFHNAGIFPRANFAPLPKDPLEYFKRFYADTVLNGSVHAFECGYKFFGPDQIIFATDYPFGPEKGEAWMEGALHQVREVSLPQAEKDKIFGDNLMRLIERG